ncbi:hypothetical protein ACFE04_025069 [Oxalis oulophora]
MDQQQQQHAILNSTCFNLADILHYSINNNAGGRGGGGGVDEPGLGLGLKRGHFGHFDDVNPKLSPDQHQRGVGVGVGVGEARCGDVEDDFNKLLQSDGDGGRKRMKMTVNNMDRDSNADSTEPSSSMPVEQNLKPPKDYIHVRARRGQATDSHSLAERARREKISERMKLLQDLVPGCNKVIGKALVLDEIINYIQSLQRQVEFLSMKLEAVNSRINHGIEFNQQYDNTGMAFPSHPTREYNRDTSPEWLHMQRGVAEGSGGWVKNRWCDEINVVVRCMHGGDKAVAAFTAMSAAPGQDDSKQKLCSVPHFSV